MLIGGINDRSGQAESFDRIWKQLHNDFSFEGQAELCYYFWLAKFKRGGQLNLLRYADLVGMANRAGDALAAYLTSLARPEGAQLHVALVGHSLGCRVALATARELRAQHVHTRLLLMGAAVPEYECGTGGQYPRTPADAAHTTLLWSNRDTGLGFLVLAR